MVLRGLVGVDGGCLPRGKTVVLEWVRGRRVLKRPHIRTRLEGRGWGHRTHTSYGTTGRNVQVHVGRWGGDDCIPVGRYGDSSRIPVSTIDRVVYCFGPWTMIGGPDLVRRVLTTPLVTREL